MHEYQRLLAAAGQRVRAARHIGADLAFLHFCDRLGDRSGRCYRAGLAEGADAQWQKQPSLQNHQDQDCTHRCPSVRRLNAAVS